MEDRSAFSNRVFWPGKENLVQLNLLPIDLEKIFSSAKDVA